MTNEKRLIDANALIEKREEMWKDRCDYMVVRVTNIENAPTVDAVPVVHAKWELYPSDRSIRCTNCKLEFSLIHMPYTRNHCPNCGAKMDGDGNG